MLHRRKFAGPPQGFSIPVAAEDRFLCSRATFGGGRLFMVRLSRREMGISELRSEPDADLFSLCAWLRWAIVLIG